MSDPRDSDLRRTDLEPARGYDSAWGWIAGAVFVLLILVLVFGYGMNTDTASNGASPPASTTGSGATMSRPTPPAAATPSPTSPSTPSNPSNGGQTR